MKVKVNDLNGPWLDYWVLCAMGDDCGRVRDLTKFKGIEKVWCEDQFNVPFEPSFQASKDALDALREFVRQKYGDEVEIEFDTRSKK